MEKTLRLPERYRQVLKREDHVYLIGMIRGKVILLSETGKVEGGEGVSVGK